MPDYNATCFSGCSMKFANFHSKGRLYAHGLEYGITIFPIIALFDFVWQCKIDDTGKTIIIRNMPLDCPLQLLSIGGDIDGEIDYESFTSLN